MNNRIIIYKHNIAERTLTAAALIVFTFMPLFLIIVGSYEGQILTQLIIFSCIMLAFDFWSFFNLFKTYILLDLDNAILIVREDSGFRKSEYDCREIKRLEVSDGVKYTRYFTFDIVGVVYTDKISSWSMGPDSYRSIFETTETRRKRLEEFASKCNELIKQYNSVEH